MSISRYLGCRRTRPIVCLGDAGELIPGRMSEFDRIMPESYPVRQWPRKWWEWDYIADCAEQLGLLMPSKTALGLGVGHEPLIFYFAQKCGSVIASDVYTTDTGWKDARFGDAARVLDLSPIAFPRDRVLVRNADMRSTGLPSESVDLVWSCSSIEHVPTLIDLFAVFKEIDRVLRVGGCAILTTEYCITGNTYLLPGVNAWNEAILGLIKKSLVGFEMLGEVDLSFNAMHPANAPKPRRYPPNPFIPQCLSLIPHYTHSATMALMAGLSLVAPIAFIIRKTSRDGVLDWEKAAVPEHLRLYSDGVRALLAGNADEACSKLEAVHAGAGDDPQMQHHAFRFLIEARARRGEMSDRHQFAARIDEFLGTLPAGAVQDADCLDMIAYLLEQCGRTDTALATYERCLTSPSISCDHLWQLLVRYLKLAGSAGAGRATQLAVDVLSDLIRSGKSWKELEDGFFNTASDQLSTDIVPKIRRGLGGRIDVADGAPATDQSYAKRALSIFRGLGASA